MAAKCKKELDQREESPPSSALKSQFLPYLNDHPEPTRCLLCEKTFTLPTAEKECLSHLFERHRLVIGDVSKIASLKSYFHYWRNRLQDQPLPTFCSTILMDTTPDGKPSKDEVYYLLSDCMMEEDRTVRDEIHRAKLDWILSQQSQERALDTNFRRGCIFCRQEFQDCRLTYLRHLTEKHHLHLGNLSNLVFVDELLQKLEDSIQRLTCIYCEKVFRDRTVLKEHMRKKFHKMINPKNRNYDRFFLSNYVEPRGGPSTGGRGAGWRTQREEEDFSGSDEGAGVTTFSDDEDKSISGGNTHSGQDSDWSDWYEDEVVRCLFCETSKKSFEELVEHHLAYHHFDFHWETRDYDFYQKVKIVNFMRKQIREKRCVYCNEEFLDHRELEDHMDRYQHAEIPPVQLWNHPEYYFPLTENDPFLYHLDQDEDDVL